MVPAAPVVEHLRDLARAGIGLRTIAATSSVSRDQLARIRSGAVTVIQRTTAHAILSAPAAPPDSALVDAAPSHRHLADLLAAGWTHADIAAGLGRAGRSVTLGRHKVRARTHRTLSTLWDHECARRPHGTIEHYRQGCRCSLCRAASARDRAAYRSGSHATDDVAALYEALADAVRARALPWRAGAACAHLPVSHMVPPVEPDASVLAVCATCPVRTECADARQGSAGIWGGVWYGHDERAP